MSLVTIHVQSAQLAQIMLTVLNVMVRRTLILVCKMPQKNVTNQQISIHTNFYLTLLTKVIEKSLKSVTVRKYEGMKECGLLTL